MTETYVRQFEAFAANGGSEGPTWLPGLRRAAMDRFAAVGFPSARDEEWRFTPVGPIAQAEFQPAVPGKVTRDALAPFLFGHAEWPQLVFVNGKYAPELSVVPALPPGVRLGNLAAALREDGELLQRHLTRHAAPETTPFAALNTAFMRDGALVHVPAGTTLEQPVHLLFVTSPDAAGTVALGVHVSQSSGLAGAIREGDHVTAIAIVDPQNLGTFTLATTGVVPGTPEPDATPLPTPKPQTAAARLTITGLKVLLVPQSFRYEEVPQDKTGDLSPVRSSVGNQQNSVILLQAPLAPIEVAPGQRMSPAELLALLDEKASIHLALEPREGVTTAIDATGVQLADVYALLIGSSPVTPTPAAILPSAPLTVTVPVTP